MKPESIEMVQKETEEPDTASSVAEGVDGESPATSDSAAPSSIGMETSGPGDDESRPGNGDTEPPPVASEPIAQSAEGVDTPSPTNHEAEPPVVEDSVTDSPGADEETAHATPDASARDFRELFGYRRPAPAFTVPEGVTPQDRRRFAPRGSNVPQRDCQHTLRIAILVEMSGCRAGSMNRRMGYRHIPGVRVGRVLRRYFHLTRVLSGPTGPSRATHDKGYPEAGPTWHLPTDTDSGTGTAAG